MSRVLILLLSACIFTTAHSAHVHGRSGKHSRGSSISKDSRRLPDAHKRSDDEPSKQPVCDSDECQFIAEIMKASMNNSVDPCDDFYEYACGMWPENNMIPDTEVPYSLWSFVARDVSNRTENLMEREPSPDDVLPLKLARKYHEACMDVDGIERTGVEPLLTTVSRIGGWPLIMEADEWNEEDFDWNKVDDYYARLQGSNMFYKVEAAPTDEDMQELIADIKYPELPEDFRFLTNGFDDDDSDEDSEEDECSANDEDDSDEDSDEDVKLPNSSEVPADSMDPSSEETMPDQSDDSDEEESDSEKSDEEEEEDNNLGSPSEEPEEDDKRKKVGKTHSRKSMSKKGNSKLRRHRKIKKLATKEFDEEKDKKKESRHKKDSRKRASKMDAKHKNVRVMGKSRTYKKKSKTLDGPKRAQKWKIARRVERSAEDSTEANETTDSTDERAQKYAKFIRETAIALAEARGDDIPKESMERDIKDLVDFLLEYNHIITPPDHPGRNTTIEEWQEEYDGLVAKDSKGRINWYEKLSTLFNEANVNIESSMSIRLPAEEYLKNLSSLLDKTPTRTIVNYMHWNFLSRMLITSTRKMRALYYDWPLEENKRKVESSKMRYKFCVQASDDTDLVGYEYVKKYFVEEVRTSANDMVEHIQKAVKAKVEKCEWLNDWGKNFVLDKLQNMKKLVGFPDWYKNTTALNRYYSGLVIGPSFFENVLGYQRYQVWKDLRMIESQKIDLMSIMNPLMLNAFYVPQFNTLAVSAVDLQSPLFGARRPATLNYGIIGAVLGHEVNHGFDNDGRKYDKSGRMTEWLSTMVQEYTKRANCFVKQFDNYTSDLPFGDILDDYGLQTRDENIADTMGLEACYDALKMAIKENGTPEATLPGFEDLSTDQLFFLSYANLWCGTAKSNAMASIMALFDEHSTGPLRVRGSLSNMEAFGKAFNCPVGSRMNPEKKCNIWK